MIPAVLVVPPRQVLEGMPRWALILLIVLYGLLTIIIFAIAISHEIDHWKRRHRD